MPGKFDDRWLCERVVFPDSRVAADAVLSLYKDKSVAASHTANESLYSIVADRSRATRRDLSIEHNLRMQFGLDLDQLASYHHEERLGLVKTFWSFNHCWALKAWAAHLLTGPAGRPMIVHFDAHDDLAMPMIGVTGAEGVFTAPLGDSMLDLRDRSTIDEFMLRGFIGIDSFITPIVHTLPELDIIHVARDHEATPKEFELVVQQLVETTITGRRLRRPAVRLASASADARFRYTRTSDVALALERAAGRDLILDVDLNYFYDAFDHKRPGADGSARTLWRDETECLIDGLQRSLEASRAVPSLVTFALSPGGFPSEGWSTTLPRLREVISSTRPSSAPTPADNAPSV